MINGPRLSQLCRTSSRVCNSENSTVIVESEHLMSVTSSSISSRTSAGSLYLVCVLATREFQPGNDGLSAGECKLVLLDVIFRTYLQHIHECNLSLA